MKSYDLAKIVSVIILVVIIHQSATIGMRLFHRGGHKPGNFTICQNNLKNIGTALEMYSTDYQGHYPPSMNLITPDYLKTIPTCPSAGKDTYSHYYRSVYCPDSRNDAYTFFCQGGNHSRYDVPDNYPQYNSTEGIITRP